MFEILSFFGSQAFEYLQKIFYNEEMSVYVDSAIGLKSMHVVNQIHNNDLQ